MGQDGNTIGVYGRRFKVENGQVAPEDGEFNITGDGQQASVVKAADSKLMVTWTTSNEDGDSYGISGRLIDPINPAGSGTAFRINSETASMQQLSAVERLADGSFVAVWGSYTQDGSDYGIFGQQFTADGQPRGDEFQINVGTEDRQLYPDVTALAGRDFIVTWSSRIQSTSEGNIYGRRYTLNDQDEIVPEAEVGEFLISDQFTTNAIDDAPPKAEALPDGGFVVTWQAHGHVDDWDMYIKRYDADGNVVEVLRSGVMPTAGHDSIEGTAEADVIDGLAGDDQLLGGEGDDYLYGVSGDDSLVGGDGDDRLYGGADNDGLSGGAGNDTLDGGSGDDVLGHDTGDDRLVGGEGADTADYGTVSETLTVDLSDVTNGEVTVSLTGEQDRLIGIENVIGGSGDDTLTGGDGANSLSGGVGVDVLKGGEGDDTLAGGAGDDELRGDGGSDTADYTDATATVTVDLSATPNPTDGHITASVGISETDKLFDIENLSGSGYGDTLTGNDGANVIAGGGGADNVSGNDGDDVLSGDAGSDALSGGEGDDTIAGGADGDTLYGDAGNDVLSGGDGADSLYGGTGDDTLAGGRGDDQLSGDEGDDQLSGDEGDDLLAGGAGADTLDGGTGVNTASYLGSDSVVTINLSDLSASGGHAEGDVLIENTFHNVEGSRHGDSLTGDAGANRLAGKAGTDSLKGEGGDDTLIGGSGTDTLDGGAGSDTISYDGSWSGVSVDLETRETSGGHAEGDVIVENTIENLEGSAFDDLLTGDASANTLMGGDGDDVLRGGGGDDRLDGGDGDSDTADYGAVSEAVNVNLSDVTNGEVTVSFTGEQDTLVDIENVTGGSGDDSLTGDVGANVLIGGAGADVLTGGSGDDILQGGGGNDTLDGGVGDSDTADYSAVSETVNVDLSDTTVTVSFTNGEQDTLIDIENVTGGSGDDSLTGDDEANVLEGGAGNDVLDGGANDDILAGGAGNDDLTGGTGSDTADYLEAQAGVSVTLEHDATVTATVGDDEDSLTSIENLIGSRYDDTLTGDVGDNVFDGNGGDDVLSGNGGDDVLSGNGGDDVLSGNGGDDVLSGGGGNDVLSGDSGNDELAGEDGADILDGGSGRDTLTGGAGDDVLSGGSGEDVAVYSGNYLDYGIDIDIDPETEAVTVTVADYDTLDGNDGTDTLDGDIEELQFADRTIYLDDRNNAPVAVDDTEFSTLEDTPLTIAASALVGNDDDFDSDTLTISAVDNTTAVGGTVSLDENGDVVFTPETNFNGDATFDVTVDDGNGGTDTATVTVTVDPVNDAATITGDATGDVNAGDASASGQLTVDDVDIDESLFGAETNKLSTGGYGRLTLATDGGWTFSLDNDHADVKALTIGQTLTDTVTVSSDDGTEQDITIAITGTNHAPEVAQTIAAQSTPEDATFSFDVPAGTFTDFDQETLTLTATLANGDPLPSWLTLTGNTFAGTPAEESDVGTISVKVTAEDPSGATAETTFDLEVAPVNDAPVVVADTNSISDGPAPDPVNGTLLGAANDSDAEGDTLTIVQVNGQTISGNQTISGTYGDLTIQTDGGYEYTLDTASAAVEALGVGESLPETFTYQVSDGNGGTDQATLTITIHGTNDAPTLTADTAATNEGVSLTIAATDLVANGNDVDTNDSLSLSGVGNALNGSVEIDGGNVVFTPTPGFTGDATFEYTVSDGNGGTATETVTVTVHDGLVASASALQVAEDGAADWKLSVSGGSGTLTYGLVAGTGETLTSGPGSETLTTSAGKEVILDTATGAYTYTAAQGYTGEDSFDFRVTDDATGVSSTATVDVGVGTEPAFEIANSVRLDSDNYLSWTPGGPSVSSWTLSTWVKWNPAESGSYATILDTKVAQQTGADFQLSLGDGTTTPGKLVLHQSPANIFVTTEAFDDPNAWYHTYRGRRRRGGERVRQDQTLRGRRRDHGLRHGQPVDGLGSGGHGQPRAPFRRSPLRPHELRVRRRHGRHPLRRGQPAGGHEIRV